MAHSDNDSELSEAPATTTTPFTIAARSVASTTGPKPASRTRNVATRRGVVPPKFELLECLKSWFRIGIFTEQDLYAIIDTMEEGATEAMEDLEAAVD